MAAIKKVNGTLLIVIVILLTILLLVDRYYWALISQWREDQATNIWLGYTQVLFHIPVGLMSSKQIPNPNGMLILGYFLSYLPNLFMVSLFLGISQIILITLVALTSSKRNRGIFLFVLAPSLTSVILRSASIEFWNQYLLISINLIFLLVALRYLEKPSLWFIPLIVALICIVPSLYLAGIVNAFAMVVLTLGIILYKRPDRKNILPVALVIILIVSASLLLTWRPYFKSINTQQILGINEKKMEPADMIKTAWDSLYKFPLYTAFQWANRSTFEGAIKYADSRIISQPANIMLKVVAKAYWLQAIFAFCIFAYGILRGIATTKEDRFKYDPSLTPTVVLAGLFIIISYTVSTWLGGPDWINNKRPDQLVQFLPMSLLVIFLLPFVLIINGNAGKIISTLSYLSLTLFCASNLLSGFMLIHDHLAYHGNVLTEADVTLMDKMRVVEFIADDWSKHSDSKTIPVDYRLGGGKWDWVPEFGLSLTPWYPAPFTEGRGFDYSLKRQYGLTNQQEGVQLRAFGTGRYLVTYAFEDPPVVDQGTITHYMIGRLRVSIVAK